MTAPSDIILGSLIGDALALGPHWIYDQAVIRHKLGHLTTYQAPITTYHAGKTAGDLTHYGDQTLVLLRSLAETGGFDPGPSPTPGGHSGRIRPPTPTATARPRPRSPTSAPARRPRTSDEIAGAARIAPLFLLKWRMTTRSLPRRGRKPHSLTATAPPSRPRSFSRGSPSPCRTGQ